MLIIHLVMFVAEAICLVSGKDELAQLFLQYEGLQCT